MDEQFREAVLDPEEDVAADALVLCCESCGAPSKFRCSLCDRLVCAFCQLKQPLAVCASSARAEGRS